MGPAKRLCNRLRSSRLTDILVRGGAGRQAAFVLMGFLIALGAFVLLLRSYLFDTSTWVYSFIDFALLAALLPWFFRDYRACIAGHSRVQVLLSRARSLADRLFGARVRGLLSKESLLALVTEESAAGQKGAQDLPDGPAGYIVARIFDSLLPTQEVQAPGGERMASWFVALRALPAYASFAVTLGLLGSFLGLSDVVAGGDLYATVAGIREALGSSIAGIVAAMGASFLYFELSRQAGRLSGCTDDLVRHLRLYEPDPSRPESFLPPLVEEIVSKMSSRLGEALAPTAAHLETVAEHLGETVRYMVARQEDVQGEITALAASSNRLNDAVPHLLGLQEQIRQQRNEIKAMMEQFQESVVQAGDRLGEIRDRLDINDDLRTRLIAIVEEIGKSMRAAAASQTETIGRMAAMEKRMSETLNAVKKMLDAIEKEVSERDARGMREGNGRDQRQRPAWSSWLMALPVFLALALLGLLIFS